MPEKLTFGSLFAGIGGFDLGFERAGMKCVWQVEISEFCRNVLAKHWPDIRRHNDICTFQPGDNRVDVICGGFPCQDISAAGKHAGIHGERSGLFFELIRVVRAARPRIIVLENSPELLNNGMGDVLGQLAACGFDARWQVLPAADFGAPHERARAVIVAYAQGERCGTGWTRGLIDSVSWLPNETRWNPADADRQGLAVGQGQRGNAREKQPAAERSHGQNVWQSTWPDEPALLGMDDGIPNRVDRTHAIGNSISPVVAEFIGRRIVATQE